MSAVEERLPIALRTEALEQLLVEKGLADPAVLDKFIWTDPEYRKRLLDDATAAIAELGFKGPQGEHMVVLPNEDTVHNVVVCTLCSCYPWPVLGLPPSWYKDPAYRSRVVREPRAVLSEMGLDLADDVEIRVWDSSSEVRFLVLPQRPAGTESLSEEQLAQLVTRDAMVGVALVAAP